MRRRVKVRKGGGEESKKGGGVAQGFKIEKFNILNLREKQGPILTGVLETPPHPFILNVKNVMPG